LKKLKNQLETINNNEENLNNKIIINSNNINEVETNIAKIHEDFKTLTLNDQESTTKIQLLTNEL
jgi:hypothetical protein